MAQKKAKKAKKKVAKKTTKKAVKSATVKKVKKTLKKATKRSAPQGGPTQASPRKPSMSGVKIGEKVPAFYLQGTQGQSLDFRQKPGHKVVLYFYPKDDTPGCTLEGQDFNRLREDFQRAGAEVYGVSRDTLQSHEKFCSKMGFQFALLSDSQGEACAIFDVIKEKNMYGRKSMGIERSTFVIDPDGILRHEWRKVKVEGHAEAVLDYIKSI